MSRRADDLRALLAYRPQLRPGASREGDAISAISEASKRLAERLAEPVEYSDYAGIALAIEEFVAAVDVDGVGGMPWYVISRELPVIRMLANTRRAWRDAIEVMRCRAVCAIVRDLDEGERERAEDAALDATCTP